MSDELRKMSREELCSKARAVAAYQRDWKSTGKYYPDYANLTDELTRRLAAVEADRDHWKARAVAAEGVVDMAYEQLAWVSILEHAKDGMEEWANKPHNRKWRYKIDGTPITNDLMVCVSRSIAEAFRSLHDAAEKIVNPKAARQPEPDAGGEVGK